MSHFKFFWGVIAAGFLAAIAYPLPTDAATKARVAANYGKLPLIFEANRGQTDARVKFLSRGRGYTLFLTDSEAVLSLRGAEGKGHALRVKLLGAEAEPKMTGLGRLPGVSNYFIGRDRSKWRTKVPHYAKVGYEGVYPGIDLVFYGTNQRQLEYDFIVAPGADPGAIQLGLEGAEGLEIDPTGDLVAHLPGGEVRFLKPVVYQEHGTEKRPVEGGYVLKDGRMTFEIAAYDRTKPLVIDPVLAYSTYLGASGSGAIMNIAVDTAGSAFVIGHTRALDFPTTPGAFQEDHHGELENGTTPGEVFLAKLDASGSELLYATYLGGSLTELGWDVAVDGQGRAYLTGSTSSTDFPVTTNAFQPDCALDALGRCSGDVFVAVINPKGDGVADLVFSSYLGGSGRESGIAIAVDFSGRAHVTGRTTSSDFPRITEASVQEFSGGGQDAFLAVIDVDAVIDTDKDKLIYATYLGGAGSEYAWDVAVDVAGRAYLGGYTIENPATDGFPTTPGAAQESCADPSMQCSNGFVAVVDPQVPDADGLLYATLLSGVAGGFVRGVAVAPNCPPPPDGASVPPCTIYVTGGKGSVDDPATEVNEALSDVFVTRISPGGSGADDIVYSTLFGGDNTHEDGIAIAVDSRGLVYVTGTTGPSGYLSSDFPTVNPIQADSGGRQDVFVSVIDPTPNVSVLDDPANDLLFSTYLGGEAQDEGRGIALLGPLPDGSVEVFVTGHTISSDFPTTSGAFDTRRKSPGKKSQGSFRSFISKIALSAADLDNPPEVLITNPANGDTVSGLVTTITADATDNDSVTQVEFFLDGTSLGFGTLTLGDSMAGQWLLDWDTSEGAHALSATATDSVGKTTSHGISVTVDNTDELPVVTILNPKAGDLLGGTVTVAADASDDRGVAQVEFFVDDGTGTGPKSIGTDAVGSDGWSAVWNTTPEPAGDYTLIATATDTGSRSASDSIVVTVDNSDDPPSVLIVDPEEGEFVRAGSNVVAIASDDRGVAQVEFFVDDGTGTGPKSIGVTETSVDTNLGPIWSVGWNTATVGDGPHVLTATATDTSSKQTTTGPDPVTVTVDNTPPIVSITPPDGDQPLSGIFTVMADASDLNGVESVEFFVDGDGRITSLGVGDVSLGVWSVDWNTGNFVDGAYSLTATATDSVGNKATSLAVTVDLENNSVAAMHVGDLDDVSRPSKSNWSAQVVVTVHDGNESPLADVTVEFVWVDSFGTTGVSRCTTRNSSYSSGQCTTTRLLSNGISNITYTVTDLMHASLTYEPLANHDPDGDSVIASDGTISITFKKPKR